MIPTAYLHDLVPHFVNCIRDNKKPISDGRDGRNAVEVVLATYESARAGSKVTLPME